MSIHEEEQCKVFYGSHAVNLAYGPVEAPANAFVRPMEAAESIARTLVGAGVGMTLAW